METGNRLTAARGKEGKEKWRKEEEGISPRTCMKDPWTWTMMWGLSLGVGGGLERRGKMREKLGKQ